MSERSDSDSEAPEELTQDQAKQKDEELRQIVKANKSRVARESKERRRLWAQKKTPRESAVVSNVEDVVETETYNPSTTGMLPSSIVEMLVDREKKVFDSDSEDEKGEVKPTKRKKKHKSSAKDPVILKDVPPAPCLQNSLDFLKRRKMQVPRSFSVLKNSNQALRLLSSSNVLKTQTNKTRP